MPKRLFVQRIAAAVARLTSKSEITGERNCKRILKIVFKIMNVRKRDDCMKILWQGHRTRIHSMCNEHS